MAADFKISQVPSAEKPKRKWLFAGAALVAVGLSVLVAWYLRDVRSTRGKMEQWLDLKLPRSAQDLHYWYEQGLGSTARLSCRFRMPREIFLKLMADNGIPQAGKWDGFV